MSVESASSTANRKPEPIAPVITPARISHMESAAECYRKVEKEILALPEERVGRVTADVGQAVSVALGALPNLLKLRKEFDVFADSDFFVKKLDTLQDHAMAALYAHIRATPAVSEKEAQTMLERGKPIREQLLAVAEGLTTFGLLDSALVQSLRQGQGNLDTAKDLIALGALFNANWDSVSAKVPFGADLVREASALGANLVQALGKTEIGDVRSNATFDWLSLRARAFRVLVEEYDELSRAVAFIRWHHGDARAFVPSLHSTGRRNSGGKATQPEPSEPNLDGSESPTLASGADDVPPGMPGGSPFERES